MCGIGALFGPAAGASIHRFISPIRHRGPDDEGYCLLANDSSEWTCHAGADTPEPIRSRLGPAPDPAGASHRVALGHRRLAILDLSQHGHQPMLSPDGRLALTYNGEIYNYVELRAELIRLGHEFKGDCDTEVLLHALLEWGPAALDRLNGMFAFVAVDRQAGTVLAARDRFGIKPLYIWRSPTGLLAIASEIKQFTALPKWAARVNGPRLHDWFAFHLSDHGPETLFDGVHQVPGGHLLQFTLQKDEATPMPVPTRWYTLTGRDAGLTGPALQEELRRRFEQSVRLRLRADVPVGTGLSGGLDSSSIVCVMTQILRETDAAAAPHVFMARARQAGLDEHPFFQMVVDHTGAEPHVVEPDPDGLLTRLDEHVWIQDEPFLSAAIDAQWCVFDLVKRGGVKVTLDGHGADELLAGYHQFVGPHLAALLRRGRLGTLYKEICALKRHAGLRPAAQGQRALEHLLPEGLRQWLRARTGYDSLRPDWLDTARLTGIPRDPFRACGAVGADVPGLCRAQLLHTSLPFMLHWEDRNSMAHGVESRSPYLDVDLVELLIDVPAPEKIHGGWTKRVMREAMAGIVPDPIRWRADKLGYPTDEARWIRETRPDHFRQAVAEAIDGGGGLFTERARKRALAIITGNAVPGPLVWKLACFDRWRRRFGVRLP